MKYVLDTPQLHRYKIVISGPLYDGSVSVYGTLNKYPLMDTSEDHPNDGRYSNWSMVEAGPNLKHRVRCEIDRIIRYYEDEEARDAQREEAVVLAMNAVEKLAEEIGYESRIDE